MPGRSGSNDASDTSFSLNLLAALHDEGLVDVGNDTTAGDGGLDQRVEFFVSADGELQVTGSDALHLQVLASVASELENLSGEVLKDRSSVNGRSGAYTTVRANSALQKSVNSSNGELHKLTMVINSEQERVLEATTPRLPLEGGVVSLLVSKYLPEVRPSQTSTVVPSSTFRCRTCLLCLLCRLCQSKKMKISYG